MTRVAILGGGVGGLSAAHELIERGFEVTVYEARADFGGKARSMPVPESGKDGRPDLPAEHGFRFFPGFYQHVTDTMKRIPYGDGGNVYKNLIECTEVLMAQDAKVPGSTGVDVTTPIGPPDSIEDVLNTLQTFREMFLGAGIKPQEFAVFLRQILYFMTSCDKRRLEEFERKSWWDFIEAEGKTKAYQKFLATGMTRTLVAAKAEEMSARTGGTVLCQLIYDMVKIDGRLDNVLNGPTSEVWINPWLDYLKSKGVKLRPQCQVAGISFDGTKISSVTLNRVDDSGDIIAVETIDADYYVAAIPVDIFQYLVTDAMKMKAKSLRGLSELRTAWMTGVMFYLDKDVELKYGHAIFIDSPWSLTAISQAQFWERGYLEKRGDGRVEGILSVDVSNWEKPGPVTGKAAIWCTEQEVYDEVWAQMKAHLEYLDRDNVVDEFVDPAIEFPNPGPNINAEPLLINTKGSWRHRPEATTEIPNLFLASDYVQTKTDLATMEGANEAAREAVNGILKDCRPHEKPVDVFPLLEPTIFKLHRLVDSWFYKIGRKPPAPFEVTDDGDIDMSGLRGKATRFALRRADKSIRTRTFLTGG